jgi:agmatine/peptidylarginine deiminase
MDWFASQVWWASGRRSTSQSHPMVRLTGSVRSWAILGALVLIAGVSYCFGLRHEHQGNLAPVAVVVKDPLSGRVPGEFEHQDALLLGFNELIEFHPETLIQLVEATTSHIRIIGLIKNEDQQHRIDELLRSHELDPSGITYFIWPSEMMWVQDYCPLFVVNGQVTVVDFEFRHPNASLENLFAVAFAATFHLPFTHARMALDGGNLLSNGEGLCISTTRIVADNADQNFGLQDIGLRLKQYFRFNQWTYLKPLKGEPTGHVDTFATFVAPDQVVVGACDPSQDSENARILDENAETLANVKTTRGPMKVSRIKRPTSADGHWRTYTNVIYANGVLLVPQYPTVSPELDREALVTFQKLLPTWKVVGIDCTSLIEKRGALHCISSNIPKLPALEQ